MVLNLKVRKSRSLPGLPRTFSPRHDDRFAKLSLRSAKTAASNGGRFVCGAALRKHRPPRLRLRGGFFVSRAFCQFTFCAIETSSLTAAACAACGGSQRADPLADDPRLLREQSAARASKRSSSTDLPPRGDEQHEPERCGASGRCGPTVAQPPHLIGPRLGDARPKRFDQVHLMTMLDRAPAAHADVPHRHSANASA
jgi:hypothetical protein